MDILLLYNSGEFYLMNYANKKVKTVRRLLFLSNCLVRPFIAILAIGLLVNILVIQVASAQLTVAYPLDTMLDIVTIPSIPEPAYLSPIPDPTFGTTITRIGDQQAMGIPSQYIRHHYSKDQPWNSDGSLD